MNFGLQNRNDILQRALILESLTSFFIAGLVGIKDVHNSKTLSNKSSSISFNQKIDLLLDLGVLSGDEKKKFESFMALRNQFMHNINAATYKECYSYLNGAETRVLKLYPQSEELDIEIRLKKASLSLAEEVLTIATNLIDDVKQKIKKDVEGETAKKSNKAFLESIKLTKESLNDFIDALIERSPTISIKQLRGLGNYFTKVMYAHYKKSFENSGNTSLPDKNV